MIDRNVAPPVRDFATLTMPPLERMTLDNGITLNVMNQGEQDVFCLTALWRGGNAECGSPSVAGMTLQLMREGIGGMSGEQLSDMLEYNGARMGLSADSHYSTLKLYSLNSKAVEVIPLLARICVNPSMPVEAFSMIRERRLHQAGLMDSKVEVQAARRANAIMMGEGHPLARVPSSAEIAAVDIDALKAWHARVFNPGAGNLELFVGGRVTPELIAVINRAFGGLAVDNPATPLNIIPFHQQEIKHATVEVPGALQSSVRISYPAPLRTNPDYIPLRMLIVALGGYFGSRLMSNIREDKGLTYGITSFLMGYPEGGIIGIESSTDPKTVDRLIEETLKEVDRLSSGDFTKGEITRLQRYLMSGLASMLDTPFEMLDYYLTGRLSHIPDGYFENQVEAIASLSPLKLGEIAREYIAPYKPVIVVAG